MRHTVKLFYADPLASSCEAKIVNIKENRLELDRTIAYPQGGGQLGDQGNITFADGTTLPFIDTQKIYGRNVYIDDFPTIKVNNIIEHLMAPEFLARLKDIKVGDPVRITVNERRREELSRSHTASHLLFLAIEELKPEATGNVASCVIKEESARFDLYSATRFTDQDLAFLQDRILEMSLANEEIIQYSHHNEAEALYWKCFNRTIPCGGTHLQRSYVGSNFKLRRKNINFE